MSDHATGLAARQLRYIGVLLLRHDGTAGGEPVSDLDEAEVLAHPQNQLLAEAADVHHAQRCGSAELDGKVTVTDGVERVLADLSLAGVIDHAESPGDTLTVQRVAGARKRGSPQRQPVGASAHLKHAFSVAPEHLHVSQQVVPEADRLCHLEVGKAGQNHLGISLGNIEQCLLQIRQQGAYQIYFAAQPKPHVGGYLVVARASGVQALAGVADQLRQARLDVQVHVFQVKLPVEGSGLDLGGDTRQAALNGQLVLCADDALGRQHLGVRPRTGNVSLPESLVKKDACRVALDQFAHGLRK